MREFKGYSEKSTITSTLSAMARGMWRRVLGAANRPPSVAIITNGWRELRARSKDLALDAFNIRNRYLQADTSTFGQGVPFTSVVSVTGPSTKSGWYKRAPSAEKSLS